MSLVLPYWSPSQETKEMEEVGSFRRGKSGWKCDVDRKAVDTPGGGYYLRLTVSLRSRYLWLVTGVMF